MHFDELRVCAVCARVSEYSEAEGYFHLRDQSHPVVPVRPSEVRTEWLCDFCSTAGVGFLLPARDFPMPGQPRHVSGGGWNACTECAALIERNQWSALVRRVRALDPAKDNDDVAAALARLWRELRRNITGGLRAFPPGTSTGG